MADSLDSGARRRPADARGAAAGGRLAAFLDPASIAVIGASDDPTRIGGRTIHNIKSGGFAGPVYPINPGRPTVQGLPAFPSIGSIPGDVDCAVIALPGEPRTWNLPPETSMSSGAACFWCATIRVALSCTR